jgi:NitT/TauT family transport system ATP-binding protein
MAAAAASSAPVPSPEPLVRLRGVGKTFPGRHGDIQALDAVDLEVGRGEFVSLIGPSGCGKSTLLRAVGGLVEVDAGDVEVAGTTPSTARAGKQFGLVPQTPALLPWRTVRANVRLLTEVNKGKEAHATLDSAATDDLLREVGLGDFLDAHPQELSGGMRQRVALVRAFALGAPILLMDEPFAALDEITRDEMRFLLLRLWEHSGVTVLFVTHSIAEAVILSDRVAVLAPRPGRITLVEPIALPRPRDTDMEDSVEFVAHVARIRRSLREGMGR